MSDYFYSLGYLARPEDVIEGWVTSYTCQCFLCDLANEENQ